MTPLALALMIVFSGAGVSGHASQLERHLSYTERATPNASRIASAPAPDSSFTAPGSSDPAAVTLPVYHLPPFLRTAPRPAAEPAPPGARTVLDHAWLARRDPDDLAQALAPLAGLRVLETGDGVSRMVAMRGLSADRVAVLVDGRVLNTAQGGGVDLEPVDLEGVERIEIARGAMGALYGPDALGGAVNLVRRTDRAPATSFRALGGSDGRGLVRARSGFRAGRWTGAAGFRMETASPRPGDRPAVSRGAGVEGRLSWHPRWAASAEASGEMRRDRRDVPGSRDFPTPGAERTDDFIQGALTLRGLAASAIRGSFDLDLSTGAFRREFTDPRNPFGAVDDVHRNLRTRAAAAWRVPASAGRVIVRAEAVRDRLVSTTDGRPARDRAALALYADRSRRGWGGSAALREDVVEGFAPRTTVRAGVTRVLAGRAGGARNLVARAGAGTSFRPPPSTTSSGRRGRARPGTRISAPSARSIWTRGWRRATGTRG